MGCSRYFCEWLYNSNLNGAGALIDYCCYGAVLARCLLGMPTRVTAVAGRLCKEDILVEDNALIAMSYPRAMAVAEASWSQIGHLSSYVTMIYGTKATLRVEPHAGANLIMATGKKPDGIRVKPPKQPPHLGNASAHFVHCLQTGEPFCQLGNDRLCRDAQEILEAGLISAREGRSVALPLARF
jgi:predicted dehydrogenase